MTGGERLKQALRRNAWLIIVLVVLGVLVANLDSRSKGREYDASASVLIQSRDLGSALTGVGSGLRAVDPEREFATEVSIAQASGLAERVAAATNGELGTAEELRSQVSASGSSSADVLSFTARSSEPAQAIAVANAFADAYSGWRAEISGAPIRQAIRQVTQRLKVDPGNEELKRNLENLRVLETLNSGNGTVIDRAEEARLTRPNLTRDSALGLLLGLLVAGVAVAIREAFNSEVRDVAQVEEIMGDLPALGSIPRAGRKLGAVDPRLGGRIADAYSLIAGEVTSRIARTRHRVLLVTSPGPGDGKTTTVANLALSIALGGRRVLLVDADHRRYGLTRLAGIDRTAPGLRDAAWTRGADIPGLLWKLELDRGKVSAVPPGLWDEGALSGSPGEAATDIPVFVLPPGNAATLDTAAFGRFLEECGDLFDIIVIDAPPVLALPDAAALIPHVGAVTMVVRVGYTPQAQLRRAWQRVRSWEGVTLLGPIANGSQGPDAYGYYNP